MWFMRLMLQVAIIRYFCVVGSKFCCVSLSCCFIYPPPLGHCLACWGLPGLPWPLSRGPWATSCGTCHLQEHGSCPCLAPWKQLGKREGSCSFPQYFRAAIFLFINTEASKSLAINSGVLHSFRGKIGGMRTCGVYSSKHQLNKAGFCSFINYNSLKFSLLHNFFVIIFF